MNDNKINANIPQFDFEITADSFTPVNIYTLNRNDQIVGRPTKYVVEIIRRFFKNKWAACLFVLLLILIATALIAPLVSPYSAYNPLPGGPSAINLPPRLSLNDHPTITLFDSKNVIDDIASRFPDSIKEYDTASGLWKITYSPYKLESLSDKLTILGTDGQGIDIWTKLWVSVGISLGIALAIAISATTIGVIYGSIAGSFAGTVVDTVMMRIVDIITGVPTIVWLMVLGAVIASSETGSISNASMIPAMIFITWMSPAVTTRTHILKNKDAEYVQAVRTLGGSQARIIFNHMIPVIMGRLAVTFVNLIPLAIFYESSLVFIGLKSASELGLGVMLNDAWQVSNVSLIVAPIITFSAITISAQIIANALNDAIDPRIIGRK